MKNYKKIDWPFNFEKNKKKRYKKVLKRYKYLQNIFFRMVKKGISKKVHKHFILKKSRVMDYFFMDTDSKCLAMSESTYLTQ
jgi:hypothetical protein